MLNFRNKQARKEVAVQVRARYERIDVLPGKCRNNKRCHTNAVHEAKENGSEVAQVVYINPEKDYPVIHYVNLNAGQFVDHTLGHESSRFEFYLVKMIHPKEYDRIEDLHVDMREVFQEWISPFNRIFSNYTG